jgi:hypothetical protein
LNTVSLDWLVGGKSHSTSRFLFTLLLNRPVHAVAYLVEALLYKSEGRGFISDKVIAFFSLPNPSNCSMALGFTQLLKMSARNRTKKVCEEQSTVGA